MSAQELVHRACKLGTGGRRILGIAGAPGSGKSTLAKYLAAAVGPAAIVVPMDGFHLADVELSRLGRADRKGAPDTFDPLGYMALLRRFRAETANIVYAPAFERDLDQPIAASIAVEPSIRLIITEGNYLLYHEPPWTGVRDLLDECWFMELDNTKRRERLVHRHVQFGKTRPAAERWVNGSDEANARAVAGGVARADLVVPGDLTELG